ncbi:MAG: glycosyltransferase family protein [Colwellia sp.]|nr:glycosyltransferase family protein [Colwellia sp.]MCW8863844.1 glycosyltransferase family protein [Colwellia sp.]MCW9081126.1 glycosyltransferase family protein [Colwellia sp.]
MMDAAETLVILQARMSSSRLPNKVLMPILDKPMLAHQVARLSKIKTPHKLIIATSVQPSDDAIESLCQQLKVSCFRGSLDDVLARYFHAAQAFNQHNNVKNIVRVTGDCPLIDSEIIDQVIQLYVSTKVDYCSNCAPATLPDGLDVEVFSFSALAKAAKLAKKPSEREHVTPFIRNTPELFSTTNYYHQPDLSHYRWTVDEPRDFELVTKIYQALFDKNPYFSLEDITRLIQQHPELAMINQGIIRNEGLLKSERADKKADESL